MVWFFFDEYMFANRALLGNCFGASAGKMGGEYFCRGTLLLLLFLVFTKNYFSVLASFWARNIITSQLGDTL